MTDAHQVTETVETARKEGLEIARKIWLAGVGAYGRVYQEAAGRVEKVTGAANEMFDQLVEKGEQVEDLVRASISKSEAAGKVTEYVEKTTAQVKTASETRIHDLEERFEAVRKTVVEKVSPFMDKVAPINIFALGNQIETLTAKIDALTAEVEALKGAKAAPKAAKKTETEAA
ncbi:MAG: phasin family protein [Hyphomonadaceae bacterium]